VGDRDHDPFVRLFLLPAGRRESLRSSVKGAAESQGA
jgi:hypothetical protein